MTEGAIIPTAREVNLFHSRSDVDTDASAQHHTLGIRRDQSSPGDHIHDGTTSKSISYPIAPQVDPLGMYQANSSSPVGTDFNTTSTSLVDMPGLTLTIPCSAGDKLLIFFSAGVFNGVQTTTSFYSMLVGGTARKTLEAYIYVANVGYPIAFHTTYTVQTADIVDGLVIVKIQWRTTAGTLNCINRVNGEVPTLTVLKGQKVNGQIGGGAGGGEGLSGTGDEVFIGDFQPGGGLELWVDTGSDPPPSGNTWGVWQGFAAVGVTPALGVGALGGTWQAPEFRRTLDGDMVQCRGIWNCSLGMAAGGTLFTMPVGWRPLKDDILHGWTDTGAVQSFDRINLMASGVVATSSVIASGANVNLAQQMWSTRAVGT